MYETCLAWDTAFQKGSMRADRPMGYSGCTWIPPTAGHSLPALHVWTNGRSVSFTLIEAEDREERSPCVLSCDYTLGVIIRDSERLGILSRATQKSAQGLNLSVTHTLHHGTTQELLPYVKTAHMAPRVFPSPGKTTP